MTNQATHDLVQKYYQAFNEENLEKFVSTLHPEVIHDICQGSTEIGVEPFRTFMEFCFDACKETAKDIVIITSEEGKYAASKLTIDGVYLKDVANYPPARSQQYTLPVHAFFEIKNGLIYRISCFYNQKDWIKQVA
ncbi:MAG: nuclear transport factor 2 family protein [Alphaproteobacteria bacterium]